MDEKNLIADAILLSLRKALGDEYSIELRDISKNNSQLFKAVTICKNGDNVAPNVYINGLVDEISNGEKSMENAVTSIINTYFEALPSKRFDTSLFSDFNWIRDKIIFQLINTSQNKDLLAEVPSVPLLDLSLIFKVLIDSPYEDKNATILITNKLIDLWNVTKEIIYEIAKKNTPELLPARITRFADIFRQDCMEKGVTLPVGEIRADMIPMYVLSNKLSLYGCSCINYQDVLSDFADELETDIYILPSSVNEVILLPVADVCEDPSELKDMVYSVNRTILSREEFLSDNVYLYSRKNKQITIAI